MGGQRKGGQHVDLIDLVALVEIWQAHMRYLGHSPNSIERRVGTLRRWALAGATGDNRTSADVEQWLSRWHAPSTRRAYLGDLRSFYEWAVRHGHLEHDPTNRMPSPRVPKRRPTPVLAEDVHRLLVANRAPRRTMIALAAFAGLRVSEIAALRTDDVDVRAGLLAVRHGKGDKDRIVPLAPRLAGELAGWPAGLYFPGLTGEGVSNRIKTAMRRLDIDRRPHDLRAAFGTQLARISNGNVILVAKLMGHDSIETTMRYIDWTPDGAAAVARLFAA